MPAASCRRDCWWERRRCCASRLEAACAGGARASCCVRIAACRLEWRSCAHPIIIAAGAAQCAGLELDGAEALASVVADHAILIDVAFVEEEAPLAQQTGAVKLFPPCCIPVCQTGNSGVDDAAPVVCAEGLDGCSAIASNEEQCVPANAAAAVCAVEALCAAAVVPVGDARCALCRERCA